MCFSKRESIASFAIGTAINIAVAAIVWQHPRYRATRLVRLATILMWQFALLMQIPEAVQWHYADRSKTVPPAVNPAAYWLNLLQPAVAFVGIATAVWLSSPWLRAAPVALVVTAACPVLFTVAAAVHFRASMRTQPDLAPSPACTHLNLHWWRHNLRPFLGLYLAAVLSAILLLPAPQRYIQTAVFLGTFALANAVYSCGVGSVWCWSIAPASLSLLL
jgi:hypothetical protein